MNWLLGGLRRVGTVAKVISLKIYALPYRADVGTASNGDQLKTIFPTPFYTLARGV